MKAKKQEVALYYNIEVAHEDMVKSINVGWKVHTCVSDGKKVLVVYEKDLESWN